MAKRRKTLSQHPAYGYGYRAGLTRGRAESATVIQALNKQSDYWRSHYEAARKNWQEVLRQRDTLAAQLDETESADVAVRGEAP